MSDFERDVLGFIPVLQGEVAQAESERLSQERHQLLRNQQEAARLERARAIGRQAAEVLISRGISSIPVLARIQTDGSSSSERVHIADGWHVFYTMHYEHYTESNHPDNYALRTDGTLETFAYGDETPNMRRIVDPRRIHPKFEVEHLESEGFKKAIASLVAGLGVGEFDHSA